MKRIAMWLCLSLILFCLFPVIRANCQELETVKFYNQPVISRAPIYIALEEGFFKEQGINLEFVRMEKQSESLILLMQGGLDVWYGNVTAGVFNAVREGKKIKFAAAGVYYTEDNKVGLVVRKKSAMPQDQVSLVKGLKGKKIASHVIGDMTHYFIDTLFKNNGLSFEYTDLAIMPFSSIALSIKNGVLDAGYLVEPFITPMMQKDLVYLIPSGKILGGPMTYFTFGPNLLVKKPDLGVKFIAAYLKGCKKYNEGKSKRNVEIMKKYLGLDEETLRMMEWPIINPDGIYETELLEKYQDWAVKKNYLTEKINVSSLIETDFLEKAKKAIK